MTLTSWLIALSDGTLPVSFEGLKSLVAVEWVEAALREGGTAKVRNRKITVEDVMWLVIGIALYRNRPMVDVAHHLDLVMPDKKGRPGTLSQGAIPQARESLGGEAVRALFKITADEWATESGERYRWRGLMMLRSHQWLGLEVADFGTGEGTVAWPLIQQVPARSLTIVERVGRFESRVKRLIKAAKFPALKTIDDFDWTHPATIPKQSILTLARSLDFISRHENLIFIGPGRSHAALLASAVGGVGKTHLAIALGLAACQRSIRTLYTTAADRINTLVASQVDHSLVRSLKRFTAPGLLIIDELGYMPLDKHGRDLFFQVIPKRADTGSVILTTNKAFKDWGEVFQDNAVATAIAERLFEHGDVIKIEGSSYRVKRRRQKSLGLDGLQDKK